jgi:predicted MFS family arabinose efflux permease
MNPWRGLKNIPRNIWILSFATLINRSGTMVLPFLALYITQSLGVNAGSAGLVLMFYGLGALITAPFVGKLSDKIGALRVMKLSLIITGLMLFIYPFIENYYSILAYTFIWSVIGEAFRPANLSLIASESEVDKKKTSFALNRLAINLGMSIGPLIGGILSTINFDLLFYVDGITSVLAGIFLMVVKFGKSEKSILKLENEIKILTPNNKNKESILKHKIFLLFLFALIPVQIVFFQHIGGLPLYVVRELGYSGAVFGILTAINTVVIILIEVPLNNAMASWNDRKALALGAVLCGFGYLMMIFSNNIFFIGFTVVIWTFGEMIFFPASTSYTSNLSPKNRSGEYMGYLQMTFSLALMIGPWLGAVVLENFGSVILWIGTFIFSVISACLFYFSKKSNMTGK